jgi:alkylation response protein AidB-like acyl-CoA dehydrogenase
MDSRAAADVQFTDVQISDDQRLGDTSLIGRVLDRARLGLAAEMLGHAQASFEITSDYLKTRTQFGQLIGSFQALQHRAAKLFVEIELCRSAVMAGLSLIDAGESDEKIAEAASMAKSLIGDTLHTMSNEMVQMHGGIGMTDAHDSGLYLKRARVQEALYGSASFHRARYAALNGF